jgi:hypothetical protein
MKITILQPNTIKSKFRFVFKPKRHPFVLIISVLLLVSYVFSFNSGVFSYDKLDTKRVDIEKQQNSFQSRAPKSNQIIYIPLAYLPEAQGSEIVFNSRSPQEMDVTPVFYKLNGKAIVAEPVHIQPLEIRYVDLNKLIPEQYHNDKDWGGMALAYYGSIREMWAQLRFLRINGGSSAEEIFTVPLEYESTKIQEAAWWAPKDGDAVIALGNITNDATSATVRFNGDEQLQTVKLAPHATHIVKHKQQQHHTESENESVTINITGAPGSVVPAGVITSKDGSFNSIIRFYDTKHAIQPNLYANGLRLSGATSRMVLKNTGSTAITAIPEFIPIKGNADGNIVTLPIVSLNPNEVVSVDMSTLIREAKSRNDLDIVNVKIANSGEPGSLIGALWSVNNATGVSYDVPLRDYGPQRNSTGGYPIRIDEDYSTIVSITNVGKAPAEFIAQINYPGGPYVFNIRTLSLGETAIIDFRKIRDEQIPDWKGSVLPHSFILGQLRWGIHNGATDAHLIGRAEMVSVRNDVSASYSCTSGCGESFAGAAVYVNGTGNSTNVLPYTAALGDTLSVNVEEFDTNCLSSSAGFPLPIFSWSSDNPSVATYDGSGHVTPVGVGQATIRLSAVVNRCDCSQECIFN